MSRPRAPRRWRSRIGAWVVGLVGLSVLAGSVLVEPPPAELAAVAPANGAVLATPPGEVSLTFTGMFNPQELHLTVATAKGVSVTSRAPRLNGQTLSVPVSIAEGGVYLVAYHIVYPDQTKKSGLTRFTVAGGTTTAPVPPPAAPQPAASGVPADQLSAAADSAHAHAVTQNPWNLALLCMDLLLVSALLVILFRRPRRRRPPVPDPAESRA